MAAWDVIDGRTRPRRYGDVIPYLVPASLTELRGPSHGTVSVPVANSHIDYDLAQVGHRAAVYTYVLNGHVPDPRAWLHRPYLEDLWPFLDLPPRAKLVWELAFPELAATFSSN